MAWHVISDRDAIPVVLTKPKEKEGVTKYHVNRRVCLFVLSYTSTWADLCYKPIPLDLLTLANFTDPPTQRGTGLLRGFGGGNKGDNRNEAQANLPGLSPDATTDSRVVYPCTILHTGRLGGLYTVYAESSQARSDWKDKLQEAIGLRKVVQESNKVFEVETLSSDSFVVPSMLAAPTNHSWNAENAFTGRVTCSVPFSKQIVFGLFVGEFSDFGDKLAFSLQPPQTDVLLSQLAVRKVSGSGSVTILDVSCALLSYRTYSRSTSFGSHASGSALEDGYAMCNARGLWNLPRSCRQGKAPSCCPGINDLILYFVPKSLFAYHIEALVPSSPHSPLSSQTPQKLNGSKDVHFFSVGSLQGRTLVIYMKKKGVSSCSIALVPESTLCRVV